MKRYFNLSEAKLTLLVEVKAGSAAALATPEKIRDHFKQKGCIKEIDSKEYFCLTKQYSGYKEDKNVR